MAGVFFQLRENNSKFHQIVYLAYKFGKLTFRYNIGIKILPNEWDIKKGKPKNLARLLDVEFAPSFIPFLDKSVKTADAIDKAITELKATTNNFINTNADLVTKESLKAFLDSLYVENDGELGEFAKELNEYIRMKLLKDIRVTNSIVTKVEFIEKIEAFLNNTKQELLPKIEDKPSETFKEFVERFIQETHEGKRLTKKTTKLAYKSVQRYRTTQRLLIEFEQKCKFKIEFENIDFEFYKQFTNYIVNEKDYTPATVGKHITTLKTFLNEATDAGINTNLKYKKFVAPESESDSIALSPIEIEALFQLDFANNQRLERVRDMFVLGCRTGLRWSDFTDIKPENIKKVANGYNFEIIQEKTKNKVVIPLDNMALSIAQKYNFNFPEQISNQKFNNYLKEVAQMVDSLHDTEIRSITKGGKAIEVINKRWELVSSHTARRSYATIEYEKGTPTLSIRAITGHKTEKSFLGYIKTSASTHAEIVRKNQN